MMNLLGIALGGALGAVARYLMLSSVYHLLGRDFPYGTLFVNVLGSLLMGFLYIMFTEKWLSFGEFKLPILVGVLGAFTTFSTFSMDSLQLLEQGQWLSATSYILLSLIVCISMTWLGTLIARLSFFH